MHDVLDIPADSSGLKIYYRKMKPKYELGNVQIGQEAIELPNSTLRTEVSGGCHSYCTNKITEPFYLTRTFIHMHSLGEDGVFCMTGTIEAKSNPDIAC